MPSPALGLATMASKRRADQHPTPKEAMDSLRIFLTETEVFANVFSLSESVSRSPVEAREDEKPRLFETVAYNLPRESVRGSDFSDLHRPQPIEKARFEKINASKR